LGSWEVEKIKDEKIEVKRRRREDEVVPFGQLI